MTIFTQFLIEKIGVYTSPGFGTAVPGDSSAARAKTIDGNIRNIPITNKKDNFIIILLYHSRYV
jgi:hypothetical protein